jgi:hypothetical protein
VLNAKVLEEGEELVVRHFSVHDSLITICGAGRKQEGHLTE